MLVELRWLFWEVCFKAQKLIILTHKYYLYMWGDYNDITIFSLTEYKHITLTIKLGHIYDTIPACYIECSRSESKPEASVMFWMEVEIRFFLFLSYHRGCNYLVCDVIDYGIHQLTLRVCVWVFNFPFH